MAYPYTTLTVSYGTSSTATLTIPPNSNFSDYIQAILKNGFFVQQNIAATQPATATFVPSSQITEITAS